MRLPTNLTLRRSYALSVVLVVAHLLVAAGLLATDLPIVGGLVALSVLAWSLLTSLRRTPQGALVLGGEGQLTRIGVDGTAVDATIDASTTVMPWLIVLRLRMPTGVESLALPVDALGIDGHRQLRVWLRWKATCEKG